MNFSMVFSIIFWVYLTFGFVGLLINRSKSENRLFFVIMLLFSIWALNIQITSIIKDPATASVIRKNSVLSWGLVYSVILHFVLVCSGYYKLFISKISNVTMNIILYSPALINMILYFDNSYTENELVKTSVGWIPRSLIDRGFVWDNYFYLYYLGNMLIAIAVLIYWRVKTDILREKKQVNLLLIGFALALLLGSLFEIVLPINGFLLPHGSTLIVLIIPLGLVLYAILRYGFLSFGSSKIVAELMSISNEGIILCDVDGVIKEINSGALSLLEYQERNSLYSIDEIGIPAGDISDFVAKKMKLKKSNGVKMHALLSAKTLFDSVGEIYGFLVMFLNIDDLEKAQEQLEVYSESLELMVSERTKQLSDVNEKLSTEIVIRKKSEIENIHIANHDFLTGLFNRRYYEQKLIELDKEQFYPITIAVADINGLKLINDAFGHYSGDKLLRSASRIIKDNCKADGIAARIGGDEFLMLLPNTSSSEADQIVKSIKMQAKKTIVESIELSISFGYATKTMAEQNIEEIYRTAEDYMYRQKLSEIPSMRSSAIETILSTLYEKDEDSEIHSRRVSEICERLAMKLGLSQQEVSMARTSGLLHDIGKIIIPINIISKKGSLSNEEFSVIQSHTEIGFRILNSISEMREISTIILNHHERWDGKGYPRGVSSSNIPYLSRVITIADSFDAMVSKRLYRDQFTYDEAVQELIKCSGTQFDPSMVQVFVEHFKEIVL